jgi:NADH-quinone oxidoreductase subunit N
MLAVLAQVGPDVAVLDTPAVVWSLLWPFIILVSGAVILITLTSLVPATRYGSFPAAFTVVTAGGALAALIPVWQRVTGDEGPRTVLADAMTVDGFTVFVTGLLCLAVILVALLLDDYIRREGLESPEWFVLALLSVSGGVLFFAADDLIVVFLGLEVLSIPIYVLAAMHLRRTESQEAGFKYFILGAFSSALFLYGIALIYGATGSTNLRIIVNTLGQVNARGLTPQLEASLLLAGMALLLVGFAFKVSAVPFHFWTPDVYQGAPTPITAFMASVVKVAAFAALLRVFVVGFGPVAADWRPIVGALAVFTMLVGAFLAVVQTDVKRMLAYSSINHAGFLLVGVYAAGFGELTGLGDEGRRAVLFYLFAYLFLAIGSLGVATLVGRQGDARHSLADYRGLGRTRPALALGLAVLLFAQAGVPFTAGFIAKFRVIAAAVSVEAYLLAVVAMLSAVIAAFLYLRITVAMFLDEPAAATDPEVEGEPVPAGAVAEGSGATSAEAAPTPTATADVNGATAAPGPLGPVAVPPAAALAIGIAVGVTLLWGFMPDLGAGLLRDAAAALVQAPTP